MVSWPPSVSGSMFPSVSVPFGSKLSDCILLRATATTLLDRVSTMRYVDGQKRHVFQQVDRGYVSVGSCEIRPATLRGPKEPLIIGSGSAERGNSIDNFCCQASRT